MIEVDPLYSTLLTDLSRKEGVMSISPECLLTALTRADPQSVKKTVKSSVSFCAFGTTREKAAHNS